MVNYWLKNTRPPSQKGNSTLLWQMKRVLVFEFLTGLEQLYITRQKIMLFISQIWIPTGSQLLLKKMTYHIPLKQGKAHLINNLNKTHIPKYTHTAHGRAI